MTLKANLYAKSLIVHQELCKDISLLLIGCSKAVLISSKEPSYTLHDDACLLHYQAMTQPVA